MLVTLTDKGREDVKGIADRQRQNIEQLAQAGIKIVADYALMGDYDFLYVIEGPDNRTVLEQVVKDSSGGTMIFRTMPALPMDDFAQIIETVKS